MTQNSFCTKCHRIPSQCVCGGTFRELTDEEILESANKIHARIPNNIGNDFLLISFARAILKKASEK